MNLPHVAIYYANIINIIYSLCEKFKKKNFALGSRFFFWVGGRRSNEVATSPLGVTVTSIFPSSFVLFTLPLTVGVMLLAGSSATPYFRYCFSQEFTPLATRCLIAAKKNKVSGCAKLGKRSWRTGQVKMGKNMCNVIGLSMRYGNVGMKHAFAKNIANKCTYATINQDYC